ncbi:alkane 1-monooxygenase [Hymenobacter psychrophilus]|uniref:Alkane 1-monooxygenase n=1 Tax=Hymenobacter psychrophilus TaxID=651662 RepID=A0A1H3E8Y1_9BACT|nr:alkane 1-monooxygenase [Hymenobacter psychrophilus]SDX75156.1 alkane 1-monooxygenase [Hymenobacter psychrophilus]
MRPTDLRYLSAYLVPACVAAGLIWRGPWAWLTPLFVFGLVPLLELAWPPRNIVSNAPATAGVPHHPFFDWLLYLCVPLHVGLLVWYLAVVTGVPLTGAETLGLVLSMGICGGSLGINVAHELGHRSRSYEQRLAQVLLGSALYLHFFIEHNRGHHRHVATPLDPATSRFNEPFWLFLPRALGGEFRSAWHLEAERLRRLEVPAWSMQNQLLRFMAVQLAAVAVAGLIFGPLGLLAWAGAALVGAVLFQLVNYVEHYGLLRQRTAGGGYERVQPHHSWNSEHAVGRILLYELTRHSDHHYLASRPYHTLRHQPASPQMPTGYPGMMLLAAVPPLWFKVMNRRVPAAADQ